MHMMKNSCGHKCPPWQMSHLKQSRFATQLSTRFLPERCRALDSLSPCQLGASQLWVPPLCLGTMQFGEGINDIDSMHIMGVGSDLGINFLDTAEMYPVPQRESTQGASEKIVGRYLKKSRRDKHIVCSKICGPSGQMSYIRGGPIALDGKNIAAAIDGILDRLQTDYIDLCLLHWPDRYVPMFGETEFRLDQAYSSVPIDKQYEALTRAKAAGKLLEFGVSNETPWGLMKFCDAAGQRADGDCIAAIQNAYSLLCRTMDSGLTECCHEENVGILAYSPLAMGLLTGKYLDEASTNPSARLRKYKGRYAEAESRYGPKPNATAAVAAYCDLARQSGLEPFELALRFNLSRPLITSTVIGVTNVHQLAQLCKAASNGALPEDVLEAIDSIHQRYPNPTP